MKIKAFAPYSVPAIGAAGKTGEWRVFRPIIDATKCIKCLQCWLNCPDSIYDPRPALKETDPQPPIINYEYCKGCGICADICPKEAITMVREEEMSK